jgi:antitoxin (DNA-binding transcriptional repressor) of toxin-antitoxin stability system
MAYTKETIYNLALSALLLNREVVDSSTDKSNEVRVFNTLWNTALEITLQDLDLDILSTPVTLALIEEITDDTIPWTWAYQYPSNCAFFRRIVSCATVDTPNTHIPKRVSVYKGQKAILTNEDQAVAEIIPMDVPLAAFSASAALALAYKLAELAAPLSIGKGAKTLTQEIAAKYLIAKFEAQEYDKQENFSYEHEAVRSEFVRERLS